MATVEGVSSGGTAEAAAPARPRQRLGRPRFGWTRLTGVILGLNCIGLAILLGGSMLLNKYRAGLIEAKKEVLLAQGQLIANVLARTSLDNARADTPLDEELARSALWALLKGSSVRGRLYDSEGVLIADSRILNDRVIAYELPPVVDESRSPFAVFEGLIDDVRWESLPWLGWVAEARAQRVGQEVEAALGGEPAEAVRFNDKEELIVSVSTPIQRVQSVLGVVTLEVGDIQEI
ncbi:MAG: stimulus-sensing domain-containing protein, partial [Pseudomonadota bacterium]